MWSCGRDYCPHIHDKICLQGRLKDFIPYTIFPNRTIDSFTNVHIRCTNRYKSNVPTVAYQNHQLLKEGLITNDVEEQDDRNFVKDFYLQNCTNSNPSKGLSNNLERDMRQRMAKNSAYVLADSQNVLYAEQSKKKQLFNDNARRRAVSRYNDHFKKLQTDKQHDQDQNSKWLTRLYRKLQQVARHIVEGQGQSLGDREKMFLKQKVYLTPAYISKIKVRNPKVAFEILEEIRTLMLKKKLRYQQQRQEQQNNKSVSMSFASENSQNVSQGSMMSEATSVADSKAQGDRIVSKYCNFQELKKKWNLQDVDHVKDMIRRILTKEAVSGAEVQAVKNRKQAERNNQLILSLKKRSEQKSTPKDAKPKRGKTAKKNDKTKKAVPSKPVFKEPLTQQELSCKQAVVKGGQFDAIGERYERNRNYSEIFKKKQDELMTQFTFKDTTLSLNKQSLISTK